MIFFTIANFKYADKVQVLAKSIKKHYPEKEFVWFVVEKKNILAEVKLKSVDKLISIEDLDIPDFNRWIFQHTVVEACTAIKADAFIHLFENEDDNEVIYLDPDMQIFSRFEELEKLLKTEDVIVTPHLTNPERSEEGILINEMDALKHGVFNLGFLAIKRGVNGKKFLSWWQSRLQNYCFDEKERGIFTDQKWINLAVGFFNFVYILRLDNYNVATWNISNREITFRNNNYFVNELPLRLVHFSGFDSGSHHGMLEKFSGNNSPLENLSKNYQQELLKNTFSSGLSGWSWDYLSSGEKISNEWRRFYRDYMKSKSKDNPFSLSSSHFTSQKRNDHIPLTKLAIAQKNPANLENSIDYEINDLRLFINAHMNKQKRIIVSITHGLGGGVDLAEKRIAEQVKNSFNIITISSHARRRDYFLAKITINNGAYSANRLFPKNMMLQLLTEMDMSIAYYFVHHALHMEDFLKELLNGTKTPYLVFVHDYYFFNPFWSTIGTPDQIGSVPLTNTEFNEFKSSLEDPEPLLSWGLPSDWQKILNNSARVLVPSKTVFSKLSNFMKHDKSITLLGLPDHKIEIDYGPIVQKHDKIRVCIFGDIGPHKGMKTIQDVMNNPLAVELEFVCLGKTSTDLKFSEHIQEFTPENYLEKLNQLDPDIIWLPNQVDESYSFSFTEALTYKSLIVASDIEVFVERAKAYNRVLLVPRQSSAIEWIEALKNSFQIYNSKISSAYQSKLEVDQKVDILQLLD